MASLQAFLSGPYAPRHAGAHLDGHQHGGRKPTETCYQVLLQKREFIPLELINIKVILFLMREPFR